MVVLPNRVRVVMVVSALALAAGLLALAALATPAQAQAETFTDTDQTPTSLLIQGCQGPTEPIFIEGTLHTVAHTTTDANGGSHTKFQFNLRGEGEGLDSGDKYVFHDVTNLKANFTGASNQTVTLTFQIIRQGSATTTDDRQGKLLAHVTVNAQGDVTTEVIKSEFECR
jgi:hypothetical protein